MFCEPCITTLEVTEPKRLTSNAIIFKVCEIYGVSPSLALGKLRWKKLVECRQIIAHILRNDKYLSMSLKSIGFMLGRRHYSSIIHAIQCIENYIDIEPDFREKVIDIYKKVYGSSKNFY
jgi:chromosomal replication initiator protein